MPMVKVRILECEIMIEDVSMPYENLLESASNKVAKMFEEKYVKLMPKSKNDSDEEDDDEYINTKPPMAVSMFQ